jgi:streptogramin lyase
MPEGRTWGATSAVEIDPDGKSIWVAERCGANSCAGSNLPAVLKFDESGKLVKSFGSGMFAFPHGIHVDRQGNVWVTDGVPPGAANQPAAAGKSHIVVKFSPEGKVLLTLGKAGVAGDGPDTFNQPSDVITAPNGDIFVADGHGGTQTRIVKFDKTGKFSRHGEEGGSRRLRHPHGLAMDSKGACSSPIGITIGFRSLIRVGSSSKSGSSSAASAEFT